MIIDDNLPIISLHCPNCGRFSKTIVKDDGDYILYCENCNIEYGRSVNYSLEVWGEMCPHIHQIDKNSIRWNELKSKLKVE